MPEFDPSAFKQKQKERWTQNADHYHQHFVEPQAGPFQAAKTLARLAGVEPGHHVLDVATGTGAVLEVLAPLVGREGRVLGVDLAPGMLAVAKQNLSDVAWVDVEEKDAECLDFDAEFDEVTCQFGIMFFPDCQAALKGMYRALKAGGKLTVAVHGRPEQVPFFTHVMGPALGFFPQLRELNEPGPLRFSDAAKLVNELSDAGFKNVEHQSHLYEIHYPDMDAYLDVFMGASPKAFTDLVETLDDEQSKAFFTAIEQRVDAHRTPDGITFPWEIIFATGAKSN